MGTKLHETSVKIRGSVYQLRTDLPQERVQEIAEFVDETMSALDPRSALPPQKLSVLASLTIAGELWEERRRSRVADRDSVRRVEELNRRLEEALDDL